MHTDTIDLHTDAEYLYYIECIQVLLSVYILILNAATNTCRYYRSATLRWPFNMIVNGGKPISFINDPFFKSFLQYDMILVSVDVRGTGASFGIHPGPWSLEEQQVRHKWSCSTRSLVVRLRFYMGGSHILVPRSA